MLFTMRQNFEAQVSGIVLGQLVRFELTREFHIDTIIVRAKPTASAVMATDNADSIQNIVNRVAFSVNNAASTRNVIDVSGPALLELCHHQVGRLDRETEAAVNTDTAAQKIMNYPIFFAHPQIQDPIASSFMLPAPSYASNPILSVQISTQAQMDFNAAPTFAISAFTLDCIVIRRFVNIQNFPIFETELSELQVAYANAGSNQRYELQIPGSYTGLLLRDYTVIGAPASGVAGVRSDLSTGGFDGTGENRLQLLGVVFRRFKTSFMQVLNDLSKTSATNFTGTAYLDFITDKVGEVGSDLGSVLDANVTVGSGARVELLQDIAGSATAARKYVSHRVFGDLSQTKRA